MKWLREFINEGEILHTDKSDKTTLKDFRRTKDKTIPEKTAPLPSDKSDKSSVEDFDAQEERLAIREADLESRLQYRGISIAIDRQSGSALLLFKPSDAEIVQHVATVHQPFEVELTLEQRNELLESLEYFESLERRYKHQWPQQ